MSTVLFVLSQQSDQKPIECLSGTMKSVHFADLVWMLQFREIAQQTDLAVHL